MKSKYFGSRAAALLMFLFLVIAKFKEKVFGRRAHEV